MSKIKEMIAKDLQPIIDETQAVIDCEHVWIKTSSTGQYQCASCDYLACGLEMMAAIKAEAATNIFSIESRRALSEAQYLIVEKVMNETLTRLLKLGIDLDDEVYTAEGNV